ncbi:MAG: CoB--CoM heterodisulfide reductase iron-sulfur subunit A family protein [Thermoplasmata archaeon]|nr:MAG: CoB--CoM heterodisulfide reductase iron-sulfur subunit A family protein [Thermoplasmata archaeon]
MAKGSPGDWPVLVVGGGLAGVQAALDLAEAGVAVHLVEASPSLGGHMAQLDKTFPTNDCSMCILSPLLVEASRHPNITIHTRARLTDLEGKAGAFMAKVEVRPRYVDPAKCTSCGICSEKCPVSVPSEFEEGLGERSAIYTPFPQAVPSTYAIEPEECRYLTEGKCGVCSKVCPAGAVDYTMRPEFLDLPVGAVVVATGARDWDPTPLAEYGYDRHPDVITSLQLERLLSASGPTGGEVRRPSDGRSPRRIAWVHCAGSRDVNHVPYCSRICCMYSVKEAVIAAEHDPDLERLDLFYIDKRAYGKGFHEYVKRADENDRINLVRGRVAQVDAGVNGELWLTYEDTERGHIVEDDYDLVVLATPLVASEGARELASVLDVDTDAHGFIMEADPYGRPAETTRPGIVVAGMASGPKDITDCVLQAGAAAGAAAAHATREAPPDPAPLPQPKRGDEGLVRIGVFVCHCGINIGSVVDVPSVAEVARTMPNVVHAEDNLFTCSEDTQTIIRERIAEHRLTRVVVAACTPRTHEPLFRATCQEAGLNPYLFEMANIREHCSWVHQADHDVASAKAEDLVRMAVGRAAQLSPLQERTVPVDDRIVVVGGGIAGAQAALTAARGGHTVTLVERERTLGGRLQDLHRLAIGEVDARRLAKDLTARLKAEGVDVLTRTEVTAVSGFVGNFTVDTAPVEGAPGKPSSLMAGAVVVATGTKVHEPPGFIQYGKSDKVITNVELEANLRDAKWRRSIEGKRVVMVHCVGSMRSDKYGFPGCSRYCCTSSVTRARTLAELGARVFCITRDVRTYQLLGEEAYREAQAAGVIFLRYFKRYPRISKSGSTVTFTEDHIGKSVKLRSDLIVLNVALEPQGSNPLFRDLMKVPLDQNGYFLEHHPKLGPAETNTDGIYLAGTARYPCDAMEAATSGGAAAVKAMGALAGPRKAVDPMVAEVDPTLCWACGRCVEVCEFNAPSIEEGGGLDGQPTSVINEALCKGCGTCVARCPVSAISMRHFRDDQVGAVLAALLSGGDTP